MRHLKIAILLITDSSSTVQIYAETIFTTNQLTSEKTIKKQNN